MFHSSTRILFIYYSFYLYTFEAFEFAQRLVLLVPVFIQVFTTKALITTKKSIEQKHHLTIFITESIVLHVLRTPIIQDSSQK